MIENILKSHLIPSDNYIYGFAVLTGLLDDKFKGYNYGISIGRILNNEIVNKITDGPTLEYHAHYRQINKDLSQLTSEIAEDLRRNNIDSFIVEPTVTITEIETTYFKTLRTELSHKMVATRAGMGWIGKTDLFISKQYGPRLRLVSILIKTPVSPKSKPINKSRCGSCNICIEKCPAKAANGLLWNINVKREDFFDAWKCRRQCAEFGSTRFNMDVRICGICVAVCPVGIMTTKNQ
jgi:epoxyqueuosine reductase